MTNITRLESVEAWAVRDSNRVSEYANFYIRSGKNTNNWVEVTVASSYDAFSYYWVDIGVDSWQQFLKSCDCEYVMKKFMGEKYYVTDLEKSIVSVKESILEKRRYGGINKEEARDIWTSVSEVETIDQLMDELSYSKHFRDYGEYVRSSPSPIVEYFWNILWKPWVDSL